MKLQCIFKYSSCIAYTSMLLLDTPFMFVNYFCSPVIIKMRLKNHPVNCNKHILLLLLYQQSDFFPFFHHFFGNYTNHFKFAFILLKFDLTRTHIFVTFYYQTCWYTKQKMFIRISKDWFGCILSKFTIVEELNYNVNITVSEYWSRVSI